MTRCAHRDPDGLPCVRTTSPPHTLCRRHRPAPSLAELGLKRCGANTGKGPCRSRIPEDAGACDAHDPLKVARHNDLLAQRERERVIVANDDLQRVRANIAREKSDLHELQRGRLELVEKMRTLRDDIHKLEQKRSHDAGHHDNAVLELLMRAGSYLTRSDLELTVEACDVMVRCADAITNHRREQRLSQRGEDRSNDTNEARYRELSSKCARDSGYSFDD